MLKNDRIEGKVSSETRKQFEVMIAELSQDLRKKEGRRIVFEDIIKLTLEVYRRYPVLFEEVIYGKSSIK
jgi:uncharacterized UPF0146 family protein